MLLSATYLLAISYSSRRKLEVRKDIAALPCSLGLAKCQLPHCEDTREAMKGILSSRRPLWATEAAYWGTLVFIIEHTSQRQPTRGPRELGWMQEFSSVIRAGLSPGSGVERILTLQDCRSGGVGSGNYRNKRRFWQSGVQKGFH